MMKNNKTYIIALCLLLFCAACSREAVEPAKNALYKQYAPRPELSVAQVCGFSLCDTVRVDVVLLRAETDEAWQQLVEEFNLEGQEGTESWLGDTEQPAQRVKRSVRPAWRAMAVHADRTVAFYRIDTEEQRQALLDYQMKAIENEQ